MAKKDLTALLKEKGQEKKASLTEAISSELKKDFSLEKFKEKKLLNGNIKFKEQKWIPFSQALQDALGIPGIPMGHISMIRGGSNTGKSTTFIETVVNAQKMGVLPVLIITEMKHDFNHFKTMGFAMEDVLDEKGVVINHEGFFIYKDRSTLNTTEDIANFILDLLDEQNKGNLPYDLLIAWDSVGSITCQMSIEQNKNNPMWVAGSIATNFGNFINQKIILSRKEDKKYTNTFLIVNKTGVSPAEGPMSRPRMTNKGGNTFFYDSSLVLTFGNVTNSGTSKIKAVKNGKEVEYALRTKISCDKNHVTGITTKGTVVSTIHGFIDDTPNSLTKYKKLHSQEWVNILGEGEYKITEDSSEWNEKEDITNLVDFE